MPLADKVIRLRKTAGLSQEQLSEKLNVSRQAVSRWEMGAAMPDAANILQLSRLFGVTADYLLNDEYESDYDLPKIKEVSGDYFKQVSVCFIALEVMILLMQFMAAVILKNAFFVCMSCIPFAALIGGFEYAYRKHATRASVQTALFRGRLYKISAWLGLYFPIRFLTVAVMRLCPRPYSALVLECIVLSLYLGTALLVTLSIEARGLPKEPLA